MSKKDEALKWASELLRNIYRGDVYEVKMLIDAANACKEALGENCQECEALKHDLDGYMQANKEMLNKEWQGLTNEEIGLAFHLSISKEKYETGLSVGLFTRAIEAMLKEKNYGV